MKSLSYRLAFAGAMGGGCIDRRPDHAPIMGVAAFILAGFVGIPYIKVCAAAALPAVIYFFAIPDDGRF